MKKLSQATVREWIKSTKGRKGKFSLRDIHHEFHIVSPEGFKKTRVIMKRLCEEGIVAATGKWDGDYRVVDTYAPEIDWQSVDSKRRGRK